MSGPIWWVPGIVCADVLLAATRPDRVQALGRALPSPPRPWSPTTVGRGRTYVEAERAMLERWGTEGWARVYVALNAGVLGGAGARRATSASSRGSAGGSARPTWRWSSHLAGDGRPRRPAGPAGADADNRLRGGELVRAGGRIAARAAPRSQYYLPGGTMEVEHFGPMNDADRLFVGAERAPVGWTRRRPPSCSPTSWAVRARGFGR